MYKFFNPIESDAKIADFFNHIMAELSYMRQFVAPVSFKKNSEIASFQDEKFCDFCRYEKWMHCVVGRLELWVSTITEYFDDFCGSWRYYAATKRLSDDEEDSGLNADGTLKELPTDDESYKGYTILSDIYFEDFMDIVQDATMDDLKGLCADILSNAKIDRLQALRKHFGDNVQAFKRDDDGNMHKVTQEEHDLDMAAGQVEAEDDTKRLMAIFGGVYAIMDMIRHCTYNDDNKELLHMVLDASDALLGMDFNTLGKITDRYFNSVKA